VAVAEEVADQVLDVLAGRPARHAVNAPLIGPEAAQSIGPYLRLAEILGQFFSQFAGVGVRTLTLDIAGEPAEHDAAPITAALLRGLLERVTTERVNLVNASLVARARGLSVVERRSRDGGSSGAPVTVSGEVDGRIVAVGGTVANGEPRIVRLNDYRLDMEPSPVMLITHHRDRPGMIGRIGSLLGAADVNISAMHVARSAPRADALMVLALDDDVPESLASSIRDHESLIDLWTIRLEADH
jgi:hypothetical protein